MMNLFSILLVFLLAFNTCSAHEEQQDEYHRKHGGGGGVGGGGHGDGPMMGGSNNDNDNDSSPAAGGGGFNHMDAMQTIQYLLDNREDIERTVVETDAGVETHTWSENNPEVSDSIKKHVTEMVALIENGGMIRRWDPIFRALSEHNAEMDALVTTDDDGAYVTVTGTTECGVNLAQMHADVLSNFIAKGRSEVQQSHPAPQEC